jgi:hypothetical protein
MELQAEAERACEAYLAEFEGLSGYQRTTRTFEAVVEGLIGAESLRARQIARSSPRLAWLKIAGSRRAPLPI